MPLMVESLEQEIIRQPFESKRAKCIIRMMLNGVRFIHRSEILHRDLKPDNILVDEKGTIKLSDFGGAVDLSNTPFLSTKGFFGTRAYTAPEILLDLVYSFSADIWVRQHLNFFIISYK